MRLPAPTVKCNNNNLSSASERQLRFVFARSSYLTPNNFFFRSKLPGFHISPQGSCSSFSKAQKCSTLMVSTDHRDFCHLAHYLPSGEVIVQGLHRVCTTQIQPREHELDRADYTDPTRQHELDRTDHTDQEYVCLERSRPQGGNRWPVPKCVMISCPLYPGGVAAEKKSFNTRRITPSNRGQNCGEIMRTSD